MIGRLDNLSCHIKDSCVFNVNDATVWARFYLYVRYTSFVVLFCPEIIANRLLVNIQFRSNAGDASCGQCML